MGNKLSCLENETYSPGSLAPRVAEAGSWKHPAFSVPKIAAIILLLSILSQKQPCEVSLDESVW